MSEFSNNYSDLILALDKAVKKAKQLAYAEAATKCREIAAKHYNWCDQKVDGHKMSFAIENIADECAEAIEAQAHLDEQL